MKTEHCADCCRSAMAQFLLSEGQSNTWLLGSRLITVTTSGCSQKPLKNGLCDKCYHTCRLEKGNANYTKESEGGSINLSETSTFPAHSDMRNVGKKSKNSSPKKYLKNTNIVHLRMFISF